MNHWEVAYLQPGFYSVAWGSNADVRQFAVPLTSAARHVALASEPQAEMYPDAGRGDLTPLAVVLIDGAATLVDALQDLESKAEMVDRALSDESSPLECELIAV